MNALPPALWSGCWRGVELAVYASGDGAALDTSVLTQDELRRAERFHFPGDRLRWMQSRALLRSALAQRLGTDAGALRFVFEEMGKPTLAGEHRGLHFNLSHSGDFVALALSNAPVGVDIECFKEMPVEELAAFAFRTEEHHAIVQHAEPRRHFLEFWTAKEAVMKCTGQGLSLAPSSVIVRCGTDGIPECAEIEGGGGEFALHCVFHPGMWMLCTAERA